MAAAVATPSLASVEITAAPLRRLRGLWRPSIRLTAAIPINYSVLSVTTRIIAFSEHVYSTLRSMANFFKVLKSIDALAIVFSCRKPPGCLPEFPEYFPNALAKRRLLRYFHRRRLYKLCERSWETLDHIALNLCIGDARVSMKSKCFHSFILDPSGFDRVAVEMCFFQHIFILLLFPS